MALLGMKLTVKQQRLWDLKEAGKTRPQIAAELGISNPVVSKTINVIRKKLGITYDPKRDDARRDNAYQAVENADPERAAKIIDAASEPEALQKVVEAMRAAGLPEKVTSRMLHRLKVKYFGAITEIRNLKTQEILDMLGKKIHLALTYMDDKVLAEASFRDLALGATAMIEKRALLRGEPTQIVSDHERKKLHELMPLMIAEAQRRGITYEGTAVKVVNPPPEVVNQAT